MTCDTSLFFYSQFCNYFFIQRQQLIDIQQLKIQKVKLKEDKIFDMNYCNCCLSIEIDK